MSFMIFLFWIWLLMESVKIFYRILVFGIKLMNYGHAQGMVIKNGDDLWVNGPMI